MQANGPSRVHPMTRAFESLGDFGASISNATDRLIVAIDRQSKLLERIAIASERAAMGLRNSAAVADAIAASGIVGAVASESLITKPSEGKS